MYRLVSLILRGQADPGTVEECCSDVFMSVWHKREQFNPARGGLRTWVLILARYRALDYRRRLGRRKDKEICSPGGQPSPAGDTAAGADPESCCLQEERRSEIMSALASLPEPDREILYRRYFIEEPVERIALKMGITRGAAENRLWRARKALKSKYIQIKNKEVSSCNGRI